MLRNCLLIARSSHCFIHDEFIFIMLHACSSIMVDGAGSTCSVNTPAGLVTHVHCATHEQSIMVH